MSVNRSVSIKSVFLGSNPFWGLHFYNPSSGLYCFVWSGFQVNLICLFLSANPCAQSCGQGRKQKDFAEVMEGD
jgi:hypothetical protein